MKIWSTHPPQVLKLSWFLRVYLSPVLPYRWMIDTACEKFGCHAGQTDPYVIVSRLLRNPIFLITSISDGVLVSTSIGSDRNLGGHSTVELNQLSWSALPNTPSDVFASAMLVYVAQTIHSCPLNVDILRYIHKLGLRFKQAFDHWYDDEELTPSEIKSSQKIPIIYVNTILFSFVPFVCLRFPTWPDCQIFAKILRP